MSAILLTPPAIEPLSLAAAKAFLRIEHDDDDDVISALITGSRIHIEAQTRRALITQTWRLVRDCWPAGGVLPVLPVPLRALVAARVHNAEGEAQTIPLDHFTLDTVSAPALIALASGMPSVSGRAVAGIEIDFEAGYGGAEADVPEPLRHAVRLLIAHWYENRALISATGEVAVVPAAVSSLLAPYRVLSL